MAARRTGGHGEIMIGNYKRLESIGKGSFATVYKAVHPDDGTLLAIKTVQHGQLKGKLKNNLFSEIDILKSIQHPHIVALINILESTNHIHLVMEFCALGDLATFVRKRDKLGNHPITAKMIRNYPSPQRGGFNEVIVRHFAKQLGAALEFLRGKNLVHRDLKPQNLLLNPPSSWLAQEEPANRPHEVDQNSLIPLAGVMSMPVLKIADFGFARHLPQTTMAETLCGSPLYMAPEILRYEKYDNKADLWSVGTVLFELMAGKPPFRAANHVELLRKIELTNDKIDFPEDLPISKEMSLVIRGLLKKYPTERISWETFFDSGILKDDIPGLLAADKSSEPSGTTSQREPASSVHTKIVGDDPEAPNLRRESRPAVDRIASGPPSDGTPVNRRLSIAQQKRPQMFSHATEPVVQGVRYDRMTPVAMEKRNSQDSHPPEVPSPPPAATAAAEVSEAERRRSLQRAQRKTSKDERERAAQDVAFERDYVMVEKRAVEVNAFADEMAARNGARQSPNSHVGALMRRATTQGMLSLSPGQASPSRPNQSTSRPEATHQRKLSYERNAGDRRSSNSAITAALQNVQSRMPLLPTLFQGKGAAPLPSYGPFPAFPATPAGPLMINDNSKPLALQEDQRVVHTIEESATRSDVVFGFAEVKFKQLIPIAPSSDTRFGFSKGSSREGGTPDDEDEDLTDDAVVGISEEALVLYVKALAILTNTIRLAGSWWAQRVRSQSPIESPVSPRSMDPGLDRIAESRINQVVQWARNRFNECLEKSEYATRRLIDIQRKISMDRNRSRGQSDDGQKSEASDFHLSAGVTAEKLMYDRALDMSKTAAVNELVGEDLQGCEVSYITAMRLLEAVLEVDEDFASHRSGVPRRENEANDRQDAPIEGIEDGDRKTVIKLIESMRLRLNTLRKKIEMQRASRRNSQRTNSEPLSRSPNLHPDALPRASPRS